MRNKKVLLVAEDDPSLRQVLHRALQEEGFAVLEAANGAEGFQTALRERPDLILMDVLMPHMDGLTVMKKLRTESEWGKRVPIILLTVLSPESEQINAAVAEGEPAFYLVKSKVSIGGIVEKIKERLADSTTSHL